MKTAIALAAVAALTAGCSNNSAADYADAGTTAIGLAQGFQEANPVLATLGPAAPIASLVLKSGAKKALVASGVSECEADRGVSTGSAFGASANLATLSGAAAPVALVIGGVVAFVYHQSQNCATDIAPEGTFTVILKKGADGEWVKSRADA